MNPVVLIVAVPAATILVVVTLGAIVQRHIDGPTAAIVVVDRRTYRLAERRIAQAAADGNPVRAHAGIATACQWLRHEIHTGPKRHRVRYAAELERLELRDEQLRDEMERS